MTEPQYDGPWPRRGQRPDERRKLFPDTLRKHDGNVSATAKALGVSRKTATKWVKLLREGKLIVLLAALAAGGCDPAKKIPRDEATVRRALEAFSRSAHYEYDSPEVEALAALHVGAALDRLTAAIGRLADR